MFLTSGRACIALFHSRAIFQTQTAKRNKASALLDGIQTRERQRDTFCRPNHLLPFLSTSTAPQTLAGLISNILEITSKLAAADGLLNDL